MQNVQRTLQNVVLDLDLQYICRAGQSSAVVETMCNIKVRPLD